MKPPQISRKEFYLTIAVVSILVSAFIGSLVYISIEDTLARNPQNLIQHTISDSNITEEALTTNVFETTKDSVVHINSFSTTNDVFAQDHQTEGTGSGFIVSRDGYIYTNRHVIENANRITVVLSTGQEYGANLVGSDQVTDIAVLKISPTQALHAVPLGNSSKIFPGQTVIAIGNPYRLDNSITRGIISAVNRTLEPLQGYPLTGVIQTDAAINPGNSGGPLLTLNGEVIGITNAKLLGDISQGGAEGLGFAIPIDTARQVADEIIKTGTVSRPWMGLSVIDLTPSLSQELNLSVKGVLIRDIIANSPADKAGLHSTKKNTQTQETELGDIITAINNKQVSSTKDLIAIIRNHSIGDKITITYYRNNKSQTTQLTLEQRPATS